MRRLLFPILTAIVLAGGFFAYSLTQTPPATDPNAPVQQSGPAPLPTSLPVAPRENANSIIGPGEKIWVKQHDKRTSQVSTEFRAERYDPVDDQTLRVTRPEAKFYLDKGQVLYIRGDDGVVAMQSPGGSSAKDLRSSPGTQPPSSGDLRNVVIELLPTAAENARPILIVTLPNASFDNDTFRIFTQAYTGPDGKTVEADQVPVQVRGDDYDFDGRGLTIRWNERDRKLQLLEVAHGEKLILKNPEALGPMSRSRAHLPLPAMLAAADDNAIAQALVPSGAEDKPARTKPKPKKPAPEEVYRATFFDDVRILQSDRQVVSADQMHVDFRMEGDDSLVAPTSRPAGQKKNAGKKRDGNDAKASAATAPTATAPAATAPAPAPEPVTILWTGKLRVAPLEPAPADAPESGQAAVRIVGSPVNLVHQGSTIQCASVVYETGDGALRMEESPQHPLILTDANGARISTGSMEFSDAADVAVLHGHSRAEIPLEAEAGRPTGVLTVEWSRDCTLHLAGDAREQMTIRGADLAGDVDVRHPQLTLKSQTLSLHFDQPAPAKAASEQTAVSLRELVATGSVACEILQPGGRNQSMTAERLALTTATSPAGRLYPRTITADGNVRSFDADQQELRAEHLVATLAPAAGPSTQPSTAPADVSARADDLRLVRLEAQQNVQMTGADGTFAKANQLVVEGADDSSQVRRVEFIGEPATVGDKQSTIIGPIIQLFPQEQRAGVLGAGSMHAMHAPEPGADPRPLDVTWSGSVKVHGPSNLIEVIGDVVANTTETDGTVSTARGDRLDMVLTDAPAATTQPTTRPESALQVDPMGDRQVKSVTLSGKVEAVSILAGADGAILRQVNLFSDAVRYEPGGKLVIPGAGRMLYVDAASSPTTQPAADSGGNDTLDGATAFSWNEQLVYDETTRTVDMLGGVIIQYRPPDPTGRAFRLEAQKVTAEMEPVVDDEEPSQPATVPSTGPTSRPAGEARPRLRPTRVLADGSAQFQTQGSKGMTVFAERIEYSPLTKWLLARGSENRPVQVYNEDGTSQGRLGQVEYNVETGATKMKDVDSIIRK